MLYVLDKLVVKVKYAKYAKYYYVVPINTFIYNTQSNYAVSVMPINYHLCGAIKGCSANK